jgi:hypothetical protein
LEYLDALRIASLFHTDEVSEHDILKDEGSGLDGDGQHLL